MYYAVLANSCTKLIRSKRGCIVNYAWLVWTMPNRKTIFKDDADGFFSGIIIPESFYKSCLLEFIGHKQCNC